MSSGEKGGGVECTSKTRAGLYTKDEPHNTLDCRNLHSAGLSAGFTEAVEAGGCLLGRPPHHQVFVGRHPACIGKLQSSPKWTSALLSSQSDTENGHGDKQTELEEGQTRKATGGLGSPFTWVAFPRQRHAYVVQLGCLVKL